MEQVLNNRYGTGAGMRSMGFTAPAAAKTGTSHDAWFAGFTSNLLCVVWVGNDDYSQLNIEGDRAAGPIWGDFMKEAVKLPQYSDTEQFNPPPGVVQVQLDNATDLLADAACPDDWTATFLEGTEPTQTCDHPIGLPGVLQKIFGLGKQPFNGPAPPRVVQQGNQSPQGTAPAQPAQGQNQNAQQAPEQKKKKPGFWARLFGKHDDNSQDQQNQKH
jgi:penicillin-binding protein 1B